MVNDKMCVGVEKERLMVRLNPEIYEEVIEKEGCLPMDFTGKIMKGYVFVDINALNTKKKLEYWIKLALEFNEIAKASKKKKKKPQAGGIFAGLGLNFVAQGAVHQHAQWPGVHRARHRVQLGLRGGLPAQRDQGRGDKAWPVACLWGAQSMLRRGRG